MTDCLLEKRADGLALITLNRPESLNSLGGDLPRLFADYLADCEQDTAVRCVAVTGAGRAFCAGGDVRGMQQRNEAAAANAREPHELIDWLTRQVALLRQGEADVSLRLHTMGKPTVALVNGHAVGAGMSIALACDLRICGEQAKFGTAFRNIGQSGDYGGSYFLQRLVGAGRARELYFTAEVLDAQRALALGIANRVLPQDRLLEDGLAFCARLATGPTAAFARMKATLNLAETQSLGEVMDLEALNMRMGNLTHDNREAVRAFLEKREPRFLGK